MRLSTFNRIIRTLDESLRALGGDPQPRELEFIAILVYEAMASETREFHDVDHVFDVAGDGHPVEMLAAMFHDVVYFGVDRGFPPRQHPIVSEFVTERGGVLTLRPAAEMSERIVRLTLEIFGFEAGGRLDPHCGQNEVLSALVAARVLSPIISEEAFVQVAAGIEATIPFRGPDEDGVSCTDRLARRLRATCARHGIGLREDQITRAVQMAVLVANRDVGGFASESTAEFLVGTWELYTENNPQLRFEGLYTIGDYRGSLEKTERFLHGLTPEHIFRSHEGVPNAPELQRITERARHNLEVSVAYLRIKLFAAAYLEALAEASGGDAPLALFMGDIRRRNEDVIRMEDHLTPPERRAVRRKSRNDNSEVYQLLVQGRARASSFDTNHSPLSAFLVERLGEDEILRRFPVATDLFEGRLAAEEFLHAQEPDVVSIIAGACAKVAMTRRKELMSFVQS